MWFQFTLPRGSDARAKLRRGRIPLFNSRSREGATSWLRVGRGSGVVSIHAPARERPSCSFAAQPEKLVSIHAPARERPSGGTPSTGTPLFQFTLPRGSDALVISPIPTLLRFNSRSREGATQKKLGVHDPKEVSIHAPARERTGIQRRPDRACADGRSYLPAR
jgi:hypothetical protein